MFDSKKYSGFLIKNLNTRRGFKFLGFNTILITVLVTLLSTGSINAQDEKTESSTIDKFAVDDYKAFNAD